MGLFFKKEKSSEPIDFIIVGLGNPGRKYEGTRHNMGFIALDMLSEKYKIRISRIKFKSLSGTGKIHGKRVLLLKPQTFMNNSGQAVQEVLSFYKLPPSRCIIIFDEINLAPGTIRIKQKSSDGGQKGMQNIIYLTGSDEFPRIKIGIGSKPHPDYNLAKWVLSKINAKDVPLLKPALENTLEAVELMISDKIDEAMNKFNRK
jgi:peptidyl-tRNA hydrolase